MRNSGTAEAFRDFAKRNRLKVKWNGVEDLIVGRYGELADMGDGGRFRLRLLAVPRGSWAKDRALGSRFKRARAGGMTLHQKGGAESIWLFDPANDRHCRMAIRLIEPKRKRVPSPAQLEVLRRAYDASPLAKSGAQRACSAAYLARKVIWDVWSG